MAVYFTEECDRLREQTHLHSFTHDFHLRVIQAFLSDDKLVLRQGYHLTSFLQQFLAHYHSVPSFAHNYVFEGVLSKDYYYFYFIY